MKIYAVWVRPWLNGNYGGRYIDSLWPILDKAEQRQASLKACFDSFGLNHESKLSEMVLSDTEMKGSK